MMGMPSCAATGMVDSSLQSTSGVSIAASSTSTLLTSPSSVASISAPSAHGCTSAFTLAGSSQMRSHTGCPRPLPPQPQRRAVVAAAVAEVHDALPRRRRLPEDPVQHLPLAHVGRARPDAAPVRRAVAELVVGLDAEAAAGGGVLDVARVGVDLGEAAAEAVVVEDGLDEEAVGVAEDAEVAAERVRGADGVRDARVDGRAAEHGGDVAEGLARRVDLAHHGVHEGVPRHGREEPLELLGEAEVVDHPVVAVHVDDRLVEVEHHDDPGHCSCSLALLATIEREGF
nr:unnamed protein product [Digitaria exilis]